MTDIKCKWTEAGYPPEAFNEECAKFIFGSHYNQRISYYGHKVEVLNEEAALLLDGRLVQWSQFKPLEGNYVYLQTGFKLEDSHEIRPIRQEKASGEYLFTVCNAVRNYAKPIFKEMHSYFELTCPDGKIYNFGLQSTDEIEKGGVSYGCATVTGNLSCPDSNEFMGERVTIHKTPSSISQEKGEALLEQLRREKKEGLPFNWWQNNCAHFVASHASVVDIDISVHRSLLGMWLPNKFNLAVECYIDSLPKIAQNILTVIAKILLFIPTIFVNMITYLFLGAWRAFSHNKRRVALICNPYDFFFKLPTVNMPHALLAWQKEQKNTYTESATRIVGALI